LSIKTGLALYKFPKPRLRWGEAQGHPPHVDLALFFDLVFVGVAIRLSEIFSHGVKDNEPLPALGLFLAMYLALEQVWISKLFFDSRYDSPDLFHKSLASLSGCVLSFQANTIGDVADLPEQALAFSACLLVISLVDSIVYLELWLTPVNLRKHPLGSQMSAGVILVMKFTQMMVSAVPAVAISATEGPMWSVVFCWALYGIFPRFQQVFGGLMGLFTQDSTIPMHIGFSVTRNREFLLLMLGESIIAIILVGFHKEAEFIASYAMCYMLTATMALVLFASFPEHEDRHVMRRSSVRSIIYALMVSIQVRYLSISFGGGCVRCILIYSSNPHSEKMRSEAIFTCIA
jgi:low temperature requirement protein LtrA